MDVPPGRPIALLAAGCVLALGVGAFLTVRTQSPLFLIAAMATTIANAAMVVLGRRRLRRSRPGSRTGRTLVASVSSPDEPSAASRWVGGANLPGTFGRTNATKPLAVLDLGPSSLTLGVRPKLLAGMFGVSSITVPRSDDVEVFPVRGRLGTRGVGVRRDGAAPVYFWTSQPEEVLQALASADWPVSWDERRFAY
jgi:hypothetical protein